MPRHRSTAILIVALGLTLLTTQPLSGCVGGGVSQAGGDGEGDGDAVGDGDAPGTGDGDGDDGRSCTQIEVTAVEVHVQDIAGAPLSADGVQVTVDGGRARPCDGEGGVYYCPEQQGGAYDVVVEFAGAQQVQGAQLEHDGCHVTSTAVLTFTFSPGQCTQDSECRLFDPRCCPCAPPSPEEAQALGPGEQGPTCDALCGGCPEAPASPLYAVARCLGGRCAAVDIREQDYTECVSDLDCAVVPASCCGWCSPIDLDNSYAVNQERAMQFYVCGPDVECPPADCGRPEQRVDPVCGANRHCELQPR